MTEPDEHAGAPAVESFQSTRNRSVAPRSTLAFLSIQAAIPSALPGRPSKLDFFVHLIGGFISGL
jgi:hypothetical protein